MKEKAPNLDFGVAFLPGPSPGDVSSFAGGDVLTIPATAKHAAKALEILEWILTDEPQLEVYAKTGNLPSRTDLTKNKYFAADPRLDQDSRGAGHRPDSLDVPFQRDVERQFESMDRDGEDGDLRRRHRRSDRKGQEANEADPVQLTLPAGRARLTPCGRGCSLSRRSSLRSSCFPQHLSFVSAAVAAPQQHSDGTHAGCRGLRQVLSARHVHGAIPAAARHLPPRTAPRESHSPSAEKVELSTTSPCAFVAFSNPPRSPAATRPTPSTPTSR